MHFRRSLAFYWLLTPIFGICVRGTDGSRPRIRQPRQAALGMPSFHLVQWIVGSIQPSRSTNGSRTIRYNHPEDGVFLKGSDISGTDISVPRMEIGHFLIRQEFYLGNIIDASYLRSSDYHLSITGRQTWCVCNCQLLYWLLFMSLVSEVCFVI